MHWAEKRKRDRILLSLPLEYHQIISDLGKEGLRRGLTVDASESGLRVISRYEIPTESEVRIKVFFCHPDLKYAEARSHVIWEVKQEKGSGYLSDVRIMWAGQEDFRKWEDFLDDLSGLRPFLPHE